MFQSSTGSSSTTSLTFQDHTFPAAWFSICRKGPSCSIWTILYLGLHLRSLLLGCFFLKYTLFPMLKEGGVLSMVFCAILKWFWFNIFLVMVKVSLCASRFSIPESGSPKNCCMGSSSWCKGKFGSLPYTKKNGVSIVARLGSDSVAARTWFIYLSQLDRSFSQGFFKVGFRYL